MKCDLLKRKENSMSFEYWMGVYNSSERASPAAMDALDEMVQVAGTSFDNWKNIFYRAPSEFTLEKMAFLQMVIWAKTFGQWLSVYQEASCADVDTEGIENTALAELVKLAEDPKDAKWTKEKEAVKLSRWIKIIAISHEGSDEETLAAQKVVELLKKHKEGITNYGNSLKI
jgi:hypothetical protein